MKEEYFWNTGLRYVGPVNNNIAKCKRRGMLERSNAVLKSMTGFGRGEFLDKHYRFVAEIKAVNHRYNEISIRMPKNLASLEDKIRRKVSETLARGRIDIFISLDEFGEKNRVLRVDKELAMAYHKALRDLAQLLAMTPPDSVYDITKYPDVLKVDEVDEDTDLLWEKLAQALDVAVTNLTTMRQNEGEHLQQDLLQRVEKLNSLVQAVDQRAPQIMTDYYDKILTKVKELLDSAGAAPDEARIMQEVAIYADRVNFTEEVVRLKSHLNQLRITLLSDEPVGRKLDFIVQEMNRETNTIGSKANDYTVSNMVVEMKSEMEKVREQIQNIE